MALTVYSVERFLNIGNRSLVRQTDAITSSLTSDEFHAQYPDYVIVGAEPLGELFDSEISVADPSTMSELMPKPAHLSSSAPKTQAATATQEPIGNVALFLIALLLIAAGAWIGKV